MLRTKWSERLLLRKIPMMHIKKRLIELSANHNTKTNVCILKSFIFPWFTVVTCFHFHVLTTKGSRCLEFWLMVYCRVSTIDLWSHKIIGHLVKMKYCMKVPTHIKKKKTNKQTNTKTDLHPAIWILPQFQHHLPKMTANISREWWMGMVVEVYT